MPRPRRHSTDDTSSCRLADCSSQHRGQACAEARLQLTRHRSQLAERGAGSPVPPIAACTSQARRKLPRRLDRCSSSRPRTSAAGTVQLATNRTGSPRLTLFSSRRIADRTVADRSTLARRSRQRSHLWLAPSQLAGRKVQEFEQEGLSSRGQIACLQGAGCMKCPRSGVVSGGLHI